MVSEQSTNFRSDAQPPTEVLTTDDQLDRAVAAFVENRAETIEAAPHLSIDALFDLLSHPGRRYVMTYLLQADEPVSCSDLVDFVVTQTDATMTPDTFRRGVAAELTHTHLPRLDREGLVEYDVERQLVTATDLTPVAAPYLEFALAQERIRRGAISE